MAKFIRSKINYFNFCELFTYTHMIERRMYFDLGLDRQPPCIDSIGRPVLQNVSIRRMTLDIGLLACSGWSWARRRRWLQLEPPLRFSSPFFVLSSLLSFSLSFNYQPERRDYSTNCERLRDTWLLLSRRGPLIKPRIPRHAFDANFPHRILVSFRKEERERERERKKEKFY